MRLLIPVFFRHSTLIVRFLPAAFSVVGRPPETLKASDDLHQNDRRRKRSSAAQPDYSLTKASQCTEITGLFTPIELDVVYYSLLRNR